MASLRHDWYLANLGVVRYIPLDQIAALADSSLAEQRHSGSDSSVGSSPQPAAGQPAGMVDNPAPKFSIGLDMPRPSRQSPSEAVAAQRDALPPQVLSTQTPAAQELSPSLPFECRLGFWQASQRLVVLSAMPPGQRPTAAQVAMLTNLLKAIKGLDSALPPVDLIDWPQTAAIGLQGMARDLQGARDFVSVFLHAKAQLQPFSHVLLMGEEAARIATDSNSVECGQQFDLHCGARGIVTRSLHEMEHNPGLKGETWLAIKFLANA